MEFEPKQLANYRKDGFVMLAGLFTPEEIGRVQREIPKLLVEGGAV